MNLVSLSGSMRTASKGRNRDIQADRGPLFRFHRELHVRRELRAPELVVRGL